MRHRITRRRCSCIALLGVLASNLSNTPASVDAFTSNAFHTISALNVCGATNARIQNCNNCKLPRLGVSCKYASGSLPENQLETPESPTTNDNDQDNKRYLHQLFLMMRPINFPIVAFFHALGTHLSLTLYNKATSSSIPLMPLLKHPSLMIVLLSLLLVTSTSMITNDYYDSRNEVDVVTPDNADNSHYHPLAAGSLPYSLTKTFDSYLYAILLLSSAFVPGVLPRLMVLSGAIVTYLYTVHLKPKTFIKNWACAGLVAVSPVTSGLAAYEILCQMYGHVSIPIMTWVKSPLSYLVLSLFAGITSREILMDITDYETDKLAGIETIPVVYGRKIAANVAFGWTIVSGCVAVAGPLMESIPVLVGSSDATFGSVLKSFMPMPIASVKKLGVLSMTPAIRRLFLSVTGTIMLLYRAYTVVKSKGEDVDLAERAVGSSLISVLLVLASFV